MKFRILTLAVCLFIFQNFSKAQSSADSAKAIEAGKAIFSGNCNSCHAIGKQVVGPDLKDIENQRSEEWIIKFVHSSQTFIKSGDTAAVNIYNQFNKVVMPDNGNGSNLSDADIKNIIAYIKDESAKVAKNSEASAQKIESVAYPNETGLLHRIVFLDLPGNHTPLKLTDYSAWITIFIAVIFLVIALVVKVRFEDSKGEEEPK